MSIGTRPSILPVAAGDGEGDHPKGGGGAKRRTTRATLAQAKFLRRTLTPPEAILWRLLKGRPVDLKFRRQHPLGAYILDFYCPSAKLAIEIDGMAHDMGDNPQRDLRRDAWLKSQGLRVLRIPAAEVLADSGSVLTHIVSACGAAPPPPYGRSPSPSPSATGRMVQAPNLILPVREANGEGDHTQHGGGATQRLRSSPPRRNTGRTS